jgi:uncharacterized phage protein gp47/JayE
MPWDRPSLQNIVDRATSDLQTRITGATSLFRRSTLKVLAIVLAGVAHLLYGYLDFQSDQLFISSADSERLNDIADEYGIVRTAAVEATGSGQTAPGGTNGIVIPAGTELRATSGQKYDTDADATITGGVATLAFTAQVAGADGNDDPAITLTFTSPIAGVPATVTVGADGITGGADEEDDDDLRERVLARKRQPPHGGADFDYEAWALEVAGVTRVWSFPQYQGVGTIGVAFVRDDDTSIIPNATQRATVRSYIVEHTDPGTGLTIGCPVTAEPGLFIVELNLLDVNFEIGIYPNTVAVQAAVTDELTALILREGGPGETIYLSEIDEAISLATGEERHRLVTPTVDVGAAVNQVHSLGTITFVAY